MAVFEIDWNRKNHATFNVKRQHNESAETKFFFYFNWKFYAHRSVWNEWARIVARNVQFCFIYGDNLRNWLNESALFSRFLSRIDVLVDVWLSKSFLFRGLTLSVHVSVDNSCYFIIVLCVFFCDLSFLFRFYYLLIEEN